MSSQQPSTGSSSGLSSSSNISNISNNNNSSSKSNSNIAHESNAVVATIGHAANRHMHALPRHFQAGMHHGDSSDKHNSTRDPPTLVPPPQDDLTGLLLTLPNLSLVPMSAASLVERVQETMAAVTTRYLPCALFYLRCQYKLDSGLQRLQQQQSNNNHAITALQFFEKYVAPCPSVFKMQYLFDMKRDDVDSAVHGLEQLVSHVKLSCGQGSFQVMLDFTGGLREGQPYGLRKWLSDHGGVLSLCTNLEGMLQACVKLDASLLEAKRTIAQLIRPMAQQALHQLLVRIAKDYRDYLPSFHRLAKDLSDMSKFNANDIDDDIQEVRDSKPSANKNNHQEETISVAKEDDMVVATHEVICIDDDSESEDDDDPDKENVQITSNASSVPESGLYKKAAVLCDETSGRDADVNCDDKNTNKNPAPVPPTIGASPSDGKNQKSLHSSATTSLTIIEENKPHESATECSEETGFYSAVVHSKTGAQVKVKRSLRLR